MYLFFLFTQSHLHLLGLMIGEVSENGSTENPHFVLTSEAVAVFSLACPWHSCQVITE